VLFTAERVAKYCACTAEMNVVMRKSLVPVTVCEYFLLLVEMEILCKTWVFCGTQTDYLS
jgi:hypothetical protein